MTKTEQQLRDLLLKSEGRTLEDELVFGCKYKDRLGDILVCVKSDEDFIWGRLIRNGEMGKSIYKLGICFTREILGLPITLERVLVALGKQNKSKVWIYPDGVIYKRFDGEPAHGRYFADWNLQGEQTEETYTKLIELLK